MDAITIIDRQIEDWRDKLHDLERRLKKLEEIANTLYEKKLDLIMMGYPEDAIDEIILREWKEVRK